VRKPTSVLSSLVLLRQVQAQDHLHFFTRNDACLGAQTQPKPIEHHSAPAHFIVYCGFKEIETIDRVNRDLWNGLKPRFRAGGCHPANAKTKELYVSYCWPKT
jgi:hypothetical protein